MNKQQIIEVSKPHFCRQFAVAQTLMLLRRYGFKFFSWGAEKYMNLNDYALIFKVHGHHHKGYVLITLNGLDLYDVRLITTTGRIKETIEDVYADMLFDTIDEKVEKIDAYVR